MVEYQKYMFNNFVIEEVKEKTGVSDKFELPEIKIQQSVEVSDISEEEDNSEEGVIEIEDTIEPEDDNIVEFKSEPEVEPELSSEPEIIISEPEAATEPEPEVQEPETQEPEIIEPTYSEDELKEAVRQAEEVAYNRGFQTAMEGETEKQNQVLSEIKNQLMTIFAELDKKKDEVEVSSLKFAVSIVRKIIPTLERKRAAAEVKQFLSENFANFSAQETLSFAFNPDTISLVADSIGRLAEQNDFEGKIAVHKDTSLGTSDCRIEWKSGGVERNTAKVLDKIESLIDNNE